MTSIIRNIPVDCPDPWKLASFRRQVLDRPPHPEARERDNEVGAVLADGTGGAVLQNPEGNELCILRSDAERNEGTLSADR